MAHFRAHEIVEIIELGTYPYQFPLFTREQIPAQRRYPSVDVINVQPESTNQKVDVTDERNRFEVRVYIKLSRNDDSEINDLADIEKEIILQLEAALLADKQIVLEQKDWSRGNIKNNPLNVHGIQSTLTVTVLEKKSTTGSGTLGSVITWSTTGLIDIPILNKLERETEINENIYNTARIRKNASPITETHSIFLDLESTESRLSQMRTLKRNRESISHTLKRPNQSDEVFNAKIVQISNPAPFENIERITIQLERFN